MTMACATGFGPFAMGPVRGGVLRAVAAGLAVAVVMAAAVAPLLHASGRLADLSGLICAADAADAPGPHPVVTPVSSAALPNVPGKRITVVKVSYAPGGFSPPHHHGGSVTAYILKGTIRSQLGGGPIETFKAGDSFFEPPGITHQVSENASLTEPAELLAVFVADEGAVLTTYHE